MHLSLKNLPCIECRVKEIVSLGSHDMFISDVVNIRADDRHLNRETGKLELAEANPLVYVHGGYYNLGEKIGKFGWSVERKQSETNSSPFISIWIAFGLWGRQS